MLTISKQSAALFIFLSSLTFSTNAVELGGFGDRIFEFQMKLANRGNTLAEYKLGTLYEFGVSVEPNPQEAIVWYQKAADKDYLPAKNRIVFLEIKKNGFDKSKHSTWLDSLVKDAQASEPNAMILLGQMYSNGIHLKRNTSKALYFLERASSLGHTEIDSEIDALKREIESQDAQQVTTTETSTTQENTRTSETVKSSGTEKVDKPVQKPKKSTTSKQATNKESEEEKRARFEAAMQKLREEAKLLEQQQKWAESE